MTIYTSNLVITAGFIFVGCAVYLHYRRKINRLARIVRLWYDHILYTRLYLLAKVNNSIAASGYATRLLKNQEDLGNTIGRVGEKAKRLIELLKEHILLAVQIVDANLGKSSKAKLDSLVAKWFENGNEVADHLVSLVGGKKEDFRNMTGLRPEPKAMRAHLTRTANELSILLNQKEGSSEDVDNFDHIADDIMHMAMHT